MNALMNIQIRVLSAQAQREIRRLEAEVAMLEKQVNSANRASAGIGANGIRPITKWGNQVQWAGRQLQYNFTLPIVLAGAAATKFALDNEKAMVRVRKVYGDGTAVMNQLATKEIPALEKAFIALSNRFGIAQSDAINIAADWAAAGASGVALAKSVGLTMETMVLGEMNAKEATEALIAIQAQYSLTIDELSKKIDVLNMVENQTGISMQGLVQGMARAAGVARTMGVDVEHLAAMMAALVPATGSATAAGNGLKTILSRLMSPTNEANEVMQLMGLNTKELAWQSLNATQRLEKMAATYVTLDDAQKIVVASTAASRWQINRFGQLMTDINNPLGYYHRSLKATANESANFAQRQKELNTVLESSPQRLKQIWVMLQNTLAQTIQPMIPAILIMTTAIAKAAQWFSELDPAVQKAGLAFLFALAAIGPLVRYMGSVAVLIGVLKEGFAFMARGVTKMGGALWLVVKGPFKYLAIALAAIPGLAVKAIVGIRMIVPAIAAAFASLGVLPVTLIAAGIAGAVLLFQAFRDDIVEIFQSIPEYLSNLSGFTVFWNSVTDLFQKGVQFISDMFWKLPESVRDAMLTVLRIVQQIAIKIYELFSYLNPFARHSPSLVDQVKEGMAIIRAEYASVGGVGDIFAQAARDIAAYKRAIGGMTGGAFSEERASVATAFASALPLFDRLLADLRVLNTMLARQGALVAAQQAVVDRWEVSLDAANYALDLQQDILDDLEDRLNALTDAYDTHREALDRYASAPLKGMRAMEDQIFANQQAQNELRLEMLRWEEANGTIEDIQNNMASLAGSMELLRGEASSLRAAGAGSDILGPIEDQIRQIQDAYDEMAGTAGGPIGEMQKELERLGREAEILELEKSLKFDSMIREIDRLANAQEEMSFEQIVAGINRERAAMEALEPKIAAATAAVDRQKAVVEAYTATRDAIQRTYDAESAKLDILQNQYDRTADAIREIESALNDMGSAASAANQKAAAARSAAKAAADGGYMSPGAQNFLASEGGNYPDVAGTGAQIGREGGMTDQTALIDKFTQDTIAKMQATLDKIDMFGGIKRKWAEFQSWWQINVTRNWIRFTNDVKQIWEDFTGAFGDSGLASGAADLWEKISSGASTAWDALKRLADLFKDDFRKIWVEFVDAGRKIWIELAPEILKFKELWPGIKRVLEGVWNVIVIVAGVIGAVLVGAFKIVSSIIAHTFEPAIDAVIGILKNLIRIVRGVVGIIVGIFTLDLGMIVDGVKDIFSGLVNGIWAILKGAYKIIHGAVMGLVDGVIDWFKWLWDELVGHSIIPDMINAIIAWFKKAPGLVWNAFKSLATYVKNVAIEAWVNFSNATKEKWNAIIAWLKAQPKVAYDRFIAIKTYLGNAASEAWNNFKAKALERWVAISNWIKGLPKSAYDNIKAIKDRLVTAASEAFNALFTKAKAIVDGRGGVIEWVKGLPKRFADAMASVGTKVADGIKNAWNAAAKWINNNGIAAVNKVTTLFGFTLGKLPSFQGGGVIPGKVSRKDNTIIAARTGEGVIVPELVRALGGRRGLELANRAAASGNLNALRDLGLQGFAGGGIIDSVMGWFQKGAGYALSTAVGAMKEPVKRVIPGRPFAEDWTIGMMNKWQSAAKKWGDSREAGSGGLGGAILSPSGYQNQERVLRARFGRNITFFSDFRPGATYGPYTSMHSMGRAVDMTPRKDIFDFIHNVYGRHTKQLWWSPQNGRNIRDGREVTIGQPLLGDHWDHIHWGYDKGGILPPGLTVARNMTGKDEYTLTAGQFRALSNIAEHLARMTSRSAGNTPGVAVVTRLGTTLGTVEARLRAVETRSKQSTFMGRGSGGNTYHFHGDLSFPNVKDGSDAEDFLKNLKGLGG